MRWKIRGGKTLKGSIENPPSKSHTQRALLLGSLSEGISSIQNALISPDTLAMVKGCRTMGAQIWEEEKGLQVMGVGRNPWKCGGIIDAGNSGIVLRFMGAIAALSDKMVIMTGDVATRMRPVDELRKGIFDLGGSSWRLTKEQAPFAVQGPIYPGKVKINGIDSQPVTALLFAMAQLEGTSELEVEDPGETPWIDLTLSWLKRLGIVCHHQDYRHYRVEGGVFSPFDYKVPGDFSSSAYPVVAGLLTDSYVTIGGLDFDDCQGDKRLITLLQEMGASFDQSNDTLSTKGFCSDLLAQDVDCNEMIDMITILAVIGCIAKGKTRLYNAQIARQKESDRIKAMVQELSKMGAKIRENKDGMEIKTSLLKGSYVQGWHDHRIVMALCVAALIAKGETVIEGTECVQKSYPDFFNHIKSLGADIEEV